MAAPPEGKGSQTADAATSLGSADLTPQGALFAPPNRLRRLTGVPRVTLDALGVVRRAAPRALAGAIGLQIASALLIGAQLFVVRNLVNGLVHLSSEPSASVSTVTPELVELVALTFAVGMVTALLNHQQRLLAELVGRATLDDVLEVASGADLAHFERAEFFDQLQRATNAATFRPVAMVNGVMALLLATLTSLGIVVALAALEPLLVPLVVIAAVPMLVATLRNSRESYAFEYSMTTHARERLHLLELFTERDFAKELRAFAATAFLRRRYDALSDERIRRVRTFLRSRLSVALIGTAATAVGTGIALGVLIWMLATDRMSVATAATAAVAMQLLASRLSAITSSVSTLVESGLFLDDLRAFLGLQRTAEATRAQAGADPVAAFERLTVTGLSFSYPGAGRRVLDEVDLEVNNGEVVALVGENGSGKTSLVKVLCGLYDYDQGSVRWNGEDVRVLDLAQLRSRMTVLFQDFVRYHLTAGENVLLGRSDEPLDVERIHAAARQAGAADAIEALPAGYDTRLGRQFLGGHELSGGQWQRLALARAFYRGGDLLVLDEPTAALDPRAEYALFEQMRELAAGKSVLLISHRFANVRMADRIYVLQDGRVAEVGTHDALMAEDGLYAELFRLQAASYLDAPE
jgi:ATP-binding cassette subfamily B protein